MGFGDSGGGSCAQNLLLNTVSMYCVGLPKPVLVVLTISARFEHQYDARFGVFSVIYRTSIVSVLNPCHLRPCVAPRIVVVFPALEKSSAETRPQPASLPVRTHRSLRYLLLLLLCCCCVTVCTAGGPFYFFFFLRSDDVPHQYCLVSV